MGTGPATDDLDEQAAQVPRDKQSAIDSQDFEQAGSLRDRERQLLADKTARQQQWELPTRTWRPRPNRSSA